MVKVEIGANDMFALTFYKDGSIVDWDCLTRLEQYELLTALMNQLVILKEKFFSKK